MTSPATTEPLYTYRLMAYLKWGGPERQLPEDEPNLPRDLVACAASWRTMAKENHFDAGEMARICSVVASHLEILFVPSNLKEEISLAPVEEHHIRTFEVVAVNFSRGPIPWICVKAFFELGFTEEVPLDGIGEWQDANDFLDWALAFRYTFDDPEEDWCVMADRRHDGIEIFGPLAPDDPGLTYAEKIGDLLRDVLGEDDPLSEHSS
ncbi:hypothetical protein [Microvirga splendida]|uniref:Uncharacterized protein n=1 Tax=Microvirga splendida TaxID=2795727 RepID=A0ABS0Y4Z5_9HYPH|nr:hypothetical protein [Microvirga splendida]MBJ6127392.1 hypothetical protein [Microvirga splendida]